MYYEEQQDQGRESTYWTVAGSRAGRALPEYTNWTDPELTSSSSHFPFILDRTIRHQHDLGDYQQREGRAREWTTSHRALSDYERGNLNEAWQRRWESSSPLRYNRDGPTKRSDSSHRELEAWAARYSHSLPRRKRIEAELRGASHGQVESSMALERGNRTGTDPQGAAMQHVQQNPNRVFGMWGRGDRQQVPAYHPHPSQLPALDTSHMLNVKENTVMQRRMYSQPPGYIAPPPYNSPHKSSPLIHQWDTNWEQGGKKHAYWLQPTLKKQDAPVHLHDKRKGEGGEFAKSNESTTCTELKGLKQQKQEDAASTNAGPISAQNKSGLVSALQHPQAAQNSQKNQEPTTKVIEGRKFRLSKKSGGMTIFCLVSRIADTTETPSLPLCSTQTNIQSTERKEISKGLEDSGTVSQMDKISDEVDFRAPTLREQSDVRSLMDTQTESTTSEGKEKSGDKYTIKGDVSTEKQSRSCDDSSSGRQVSQSGQPVPVKYPLWREPSSTSRTETESSPTCGLKENGEEEEESDDVLNQDKLDMKDSEDRKGLLVIDTTCVVVKMELIPSPKKEHVHYLGSMENAETNQFHGETVVSPEYRSQPNQDVTADHNSEAAPLQRNGGPEADLDSVLLEKEKHEGQSEFSLSCVMQTPLSEKETSEERAERILGIPLHDDVTEQQLKDEATNLESYDEEAELSLTQQTPEDTLNLFQAARAGEPVYLEDSNDATNQLTKEDTEGPVETQDQVERMPEEKLTRDDKTEQAEDLQLEFTSEKCGSDEIQSIYDNSSHLPVLFPSIPQSPPDLTFPLTISESTTQEGPDPDLVALSLATDLSPIADTVSLHQLPSPLPSESADSSSCSSLHTDNLPSPPPPDLDPAADSPEDKDEEDEASDLTKNELNCDRSEDVESENTDARQQSDSAACVADEQQNQEHDKIETDLEQRANTSKDKQIDVNIFEQQFENNQTEGLAYVKESNFIEEQPPEEGKEDLTDPTGQTPRTDEENEGSTVNGDTIDIFQQPSDFVKEDDILCVKDGSTSEDQSEETLAELVVDHLEHTLIKKTATDSQTQIETTVLEDPESPKSSPAPASYSHVSLLDEFSLSELPSPPQTPVQPDTEIVPLLDVDLTCSSLKPDGAVPGTLETVPPPLQLESGEESTQLSSYSLSGSPHALPPSSIPPPHEEDVSPCFLSSAVHNKEPQYPQSLWDVVNRIRKHTAPDSENEDEEVNELWDPETVVGDVKSEKMMVDETEQQVVSQQAAEMGHLQQDQKEPVEHADEDVLSCSSNSSQGSEDTIIVADEEQEEEEEETTYDAKTEEENEACDAADGELCCSDEEKTEEGEAEEEDEADTNKPGQGEECTVEAENLTTEAVETIKSDSSEFALVSNLDEVKGCACTAGQNFIKSNE